MGTRVAVTGFGLSQCTKSQVEHAILSRPPIARDFSLFEQRGQLFNEGLKNAGINNYSKNSTRQIGLNSCPLSGVLSQAFTSG